MLPTRQPARKTQGQKNVYFGHWTRRYKGTDENLLVIKSEKRVTAAKTHTSEAIETMIHEVFMQHFTLLSKEAGQPWTKIVKEQINSESWTNVYRVQHLRCDAAEVQRIYISNGLKKPNCTHLELCVEDPAH